MTRLAVTVAGQRGQRDLLVTAPQDTPVQDLLPDGPAAGARVFVDGRPVTATDPLTVAGVRDGSLISLRPVPPAVPTAKPGTLALLVTSGPAAGTSCTIPADGADVGRAEPLQLHDSEVSRTHFSIRPAGGSRMLIQDAGSANGTVVAGEKVTGSRELRAGDIIWAGASALTVAEAPAADAALRLGDDGRLRYSRSPRLGQPPQTRPVVVPDPPADAQKPPFPAAAAVLIPVLAGVMMALLLHQPEFLAFTALSPVMLIANTLSERHRGKRTNRKAAADYAERRQQALAGLAAVRDAQVRYRRYVHPDPASLVLIAAGPNSRLWERQPRDEDFLELRVGTGTLPWAPVNPGHPDLAGGADLSLAGELRDAPVALPVPQCGAVGIVGPQARTRALGRAMLLSAAVLHSPADLSVTLLTSAGAAGDWEWLRWLPHARQPAGHGALVRIGNDPVSIRSRIAELSGLLDAGPGPAAGPGMRHLVVLDGSHQLRLGAGLDRLLREGPAAGIYFLCLDSTTAELPQECVRGRVMLTDDQGAAAARVHGPDGEAGPVVPELISPAVAETAARALAPVSDSRGHGTAGGLPATVRFLAAAGLETPDPAGIRDRWAAGGRTTDALLGVTASGPFVLDLAQGPHLLVAGTSGSGKSELLQTLVASLALGNRPDALNFVLIDYKGGAAFRGLSTLPHTAGLLTDLDEFLVDRALTSLKAELRHRKLILDAAGMSDIREYWAALPRTAGADPLPRLVIVVDEFAVMAETLPGQLRSLMLIGRQGRSLGVNLVLATQRPSGVVNSDLLSNINQRIALRVASADNSQDIIGTADAARIPAEGHTGRAYAWLGGGQPVLFQTAYAGGRYTPAGHAARIRPLVWAGLGQPDAPAGPGDSEGTLSDLAVLVDAIVAAAGAGEPGGRRSPWQPPLPATLTLDQLPAAGPLAAGGSPGAGPVPADGPLRLRYGLIDQPGEQRQVPAVFDIERGGHLLAAGAPQSGRSTLLRTLAGALAAHVSPDDVQLYVLDGGGALASLAALPHCGAVVTPDDPDRTDRLLLRLAAELRARAAAMSAGGYSDLAEYRAASPAGGRPPFLLVFADRYDALVTALESVDGGRLIQQLERLMRDGLAAGIRFVVTGDRRLLTGRLAELAAGKIVLRLADRNEYLVAGLHGKVIPADMPAGRGFTMPGEDVLQIAVLTPQAQGAAENRALRELAAAVPAPARPPLRVDPLPAAITAEQALALPSDRDGALVGVGGDTLAQIRVNPPGFLVIGPPGRGRSTALAVQAYSLAAAGEPLVVLTPARSPLAALASDPVVRLHLTETDAAAAAKLAAALGLPGPVSVIADDADLLAGTPLGSELAAWYGRPATAAGGSRLLAAVRADSVTVPRGLVHDLLKTKCGLLLEPSGPVDGAPLGTRLPAAVIARHRLRGVLVSDGRVTAVQVPELPAWPAARDRQAQLNGGIL
jgi:S-DNA-T family DNA segregation ATPase FtsK/SpoIIIE